MKHIVAYSGGADSTYLLHSFIQKYPGQVMAAHFNHRWHAAEDQYATHCVDFCNRFDIPMVMVDGLLACKDSETISRDARQIFFIDLARQYGGQILTGHHKDDLVETIIYRLARGTGIDGLEAMREYNEIDGVTFHKPLLTISRDEIVNYCHANDLSFINDESNNDLTKARNLIRKSILPLLEEINGSARNNIARLAEHAGNTKKMVRTLISLSLNEINYLSVGNSHTFSNDLFSMLDPGIQKEAIKHMLKYTRSNTIDVAIDLITRKKAGYLKGGWFIKTKNNIVILEKSIDSKAK